jgi:hypothetical protein
LKPPENTKIFESELATFWFDEIEMQKENFALIKQITGNKKVCLLSDSTNASMPTQETRGYIEKELPNMIKANAITTKISNWRNIPESNAYIK